MTLDLKAMAGLIAAALLNVSLLGRAQVLADVHDEWPAPVAGRIAAAVTQVAFEPLPFDEAVDFFKNKVTLTPEQFALLVDAAKAKAFTIAAGVNDYILETIRDYVQLAQTEGLSLREFQTLAADVLEKAGVAARSPWYWETVYRTNLQTSYQAGRYKQMMNPAVKWARPYWRYISARIPTSRKSHTEKYSLIYPADHPFWDAWFPPNGFNCLPGGSVINTARGNIAIEQVKHGDLVLTHRGRWRAVMELHRNPFTGALVRITLLDGRILRLTPNHKVFTQRGWVEAARLNASDQIGDLTSRLFDGVNILHIEREPFTGTVYNLGVQDDHSYCVEGLAVHNCLCSVMTVSDSLLSRRGWKVSDEMRFVYPDPDPGFAANPGRTEAI